MCPLLPGLLGPEYVHLSLHLACVSPTSVGMAQVHAKAPTIIRSQISSYLSTECEV